MLMDGRMDVKLDPYIAPCLRQAGQKWNVAIYKRVKMTLNRSPEFTSSSPKSSAVS